MKLRKLKITIIFSILLGSISVHTFAKTSNLAVKEDSLGKSYLIRIKLPKEDGYVYNNRIAPNYAKAELSKFLKKKYQFSSLDIKHFSLRKVEDRDQYKIYIFEIKDENITRIP